jgi:hypothetical protein
MTSDLPAGLVAAQKRLRETVGSALTDLQGAFLEFNSWIENQQSAAPAAPSVRQDDVQQSVAAAALPGLRLAADTARRAVDTFGFDGVQFVANVLRNMVTEFEEKAATPPAAPAARAPSGVERLDMPNQQELLHINGALRQPIADALRERDEAKAECVRLRAALERLADEASGNDNGSIHFTSLRAAIARLNPTP